MVSITSLWAPILLSAAFVFVASSILHMVLPWHRSDYRKLPSEDAVMEALRKFSIPPGDYLIPCAGSAKAMKDPAFIEKWAKGPVAFMTIMRSGSPAMGGRLLQWYFYCVLVGIFAAYIAGRAVGVGADYLAVFRFAGCTAFGCYSLALIQSSIWYNRAWSTTAKTMVDGLLYGLLTGGTFGWLWPR